MLHTVDVAKRRIRVTAIVGGAVIGLLALGSITLRFGSIEGDLESKTRTAIEEQGFSVEVIEFSGRDGTLRGTIGSEEDRRAVIEIAEGVDGVRVIHDELTVPNAMATNGAGAAVALAGPGRGSA
jgi:hypothetical protein